MDHLDYESGSNTGGKPRNWSAARASRNCKMAEQQQGYQAKVKELEEDTQANACVCPGIFSTAFSEEPDGQLFHQIGLWGGGGGAPSIVPHPCSRMCIASSLMAR